MLNLTRLFTELIEPDPLPQNSMNLAPLFLFCNISYPAGDSTRTVADAA